jgi:hypothetical protein
MFEMGVKLDFSPFGKNTGPTRQMGEFENGVQRIMFENRVQRIMLRTGYRG